MNTLFAFVMPGGAEWMIIFLVLLLLFGARKLPELARGIGRSLGEFRKAKDEFEHEIRFSEDELRRETDQREEAERRRQFAESKRKADEGTAPGDSAETTNKQTAAAESTDD